MGLEQHGELRDDDNGTRSVKGEIRDKDGGSSTYSATVTVKNVAPTATFNNDGPVNEGSSIKLSLTSPSDPSSVDTAAGFEYRFSCDNGTTWTAWSSTQHGELRDDRQRHAQRRRARSATRTAAAAPTALRSP